MGRNRNYSQPSFWQGQPGSLWHIWVIWMELLSGCDIWQQWQSHQQSPSLWQPNLPNLKSDWFFCLRRLSLINLSLPSVWYLLGYKLNYLMPRWAACIMAQSLSFEAKTPPFSRRGSLCSREHMRVTLVRCVQGRGKRCFCPRILNKEVETTSLVECLAENQYSVIELLPSLHSIMPFFFGGGHIYSFLSWGCKYLVFLLF